MSDVRIYRPAKTAMQSGRGNVRSWVLEFEPGYSKFIDPLMGWTGSADTREQVRMKFSTKDAAIAFAEKQGLSYRVQEPHERSVSPKSYADKLRSTRLRS